MSSTLGSTFSSGVQDVSAILPLMGTEQCESHVTSGLEHGFLYPAATTLSIFGSLGAAKAGLMTAIASSSFRLDSKWLGQKFEINGAEIVKNAGFGAPEEGGLSAILFNKDGTRYGVEEQLDKLKGSFGFPFEDLDQHKVKALSEASTWNISMALASACLSVLGIAPYIHLNLRGHSDHSTILKWFYPCSRVFGSFLVAVAGQLVLQHRILTIVRRRLIVEAKLKPARTTTGISENLKRALDSEHHTDKYLQDLLDCLKTEPPSLISEDWPLLTHEALAKALFDAEERPLTKVLFWGVFLFYLPWALVLIGSCLIVIGYVGCFSIVQGTTNSSAPLIWLCLEIPLSIFRMFLWASNPSSDEKTGIIFRLKTVKYPLLPTCPDYAEHLEKEGTFPLISEEDFFEGYVSPYLGSSVTQARLTNENHSTFYTFTRQSPSNSVSRQLYITNCFKDTNGADVVVIFHMHEGIPTYREGTLTPNETEVTVGQWIDVNNSRFHQINSLLRKMEEHYLHILDMLRKRDENLKKLETRNEHLLSWTMNLLRDDRVDQAERPSRMIKKNTKLLRSLSVLPWTDLEKGDVEMAPAYSKRRSHGRPISAVGSLLFAEKRGLEQEFDTDDAEEAYLSFGMVQRDRYHCITQMSRWIDHYVRISGEVQPHESTGGHITKEGQTDIIEKGISLPKWIEELERRLVEDSFRIEQELEKERAGVVAGLLQGIKNRKLRTDVTRRLTDNRRKWVVERMKKEKDARLARLKNAVDKAKGSALPWHGQGLIESIGAIWDHLVVEKLSQNSDQIGQLVKKLKGRPDKERQQKSPVDHLLLPFGEELIKYMNDSKSREWEKHFVPGDIAFMTTSTDFKMYVVNSETLQFHPDLVLKRNQELECVFFDIDLRGNPTTEAVIRNCFHSIHTLKNSVTSIGFGEVGLRGASRTTINLFKSVVNDPDSQIREIWYPEGADLGFEDHEMQRLQDQLRQRSLEEGAQRKDPVVAYSGGQISFAPESAGHPSVPCMGGLESNITISFWPPRGAPAPDRVFLELELRRFEEYSESTIYVKASNKGVKAYTRQLKDQWTIERLPVEYEPDVGNTMTITISTASVAHVALKDGGDINDRILTTLRSMLQH